VEIRINKNTMAK